MKQKLIRLSQQYVAALKKHLRQGSRAIPPCEPARRLGREAAALKLETLDVARIHQGALAALEASRSRDGVIERAEIFFAEAITPIEETHRAALKANVRLSQLRQTLGRRTMDLAASQPVLETGHRPAQDGGAVPQKKRGTLAETFERITSPPEAFAAPDPPAFVGAGGQAKKDQPRPA